MPELNKTAFNCPNCGAFSKQNWGGVHILNQSTSFKISLNQIAFAVCEHCGKYSIWRFSKDTSSMIYPNSGIAPLPNVDMPEDVKRDFEEARSIVNISPRGAAALLRLAIQKLCVHLGGTGHNINDDIALLVSNGLPMKLQKALDSVRVVGNNAVHPGQIDLTDDIETAGKLFHFINVICENQITQPNIIDQFYNEVLPEGSKSAIQRRDQK